MTGNSNLSSEEGIIDEYEEHIKEIEKGFERQQDTNEEYKEW
jgi:hypothetical protein